MRRLVMAAVALAALIGGGTAARAHAGPSPVAVPGWAIHGHVTDPSGAPIDGVEISDGNRAAWTDPQGSYRLEESVGVVSVPVYASKIGYASQRRGVTIADALLGPEDFVLAPSA